MMANCENISLSGDGEPDLSIVIAIIAGGRETTSACLCALQQSIGGYNVECIVPYDDRLDSVSDLAKEFPWVDFLDARSLVDARLYGDSSREHHDILRAVGLRRARGKLVALLEDHGIPSTDWCAAVLRAHRGEHAAVGGAVENGVNRILNWAVYYCDFGRYQNPVPQGPVEFLSDSNVSYKRKALADVSHLWQDAFHETSVNWELCRQGEALRLDSRMIVYQSRQRLRLLSALRERYVWGRSFAGTRAAEMTALRRAVFASFTFLLPALLSWRIVSQSLRKRRNLDRLLLSIPLIVLLEAVWSFGEFAGYVTGRTDGLRQKGSAAEIPHNT